MLHICSKWEYYSSSSSGIVARNFLSAKGGQSVKKYMSLLRIQRITWKDDFILFTS